MATQSSLSLLPILPPKYCAYAGGACDQTFDGLHETSGFGVYPSDPKFIAETVETAFRRVRQQQVGQSWTTWRDLSIPGQIIFCSICKALRSTRRTIADVTTLNSNVMFEIGYAIGVGVAVQPIRDKNFVRDEIQFDELGMLDTFGYSPFTNSNDLADQIASFQAQGTPSYATALNNDQPIYLVRSNVQNEGMVRLMSSLKKSGLRFRSFDPRETPRLPLHEAIKQTQCSLGVIVHLVSPDRDGAEVNNARCALVGGLALAQGKRLLMLQEGEARHPIDFRDLIKSYTNPAQVSDFVIPIIKEVVEELQGSQFIATALPLNLIEQVDLGDLAAENEIKGLTAYFVPTGEYNEAKRGRAQLVVGRKGSGKTAIFYGIRSTYKPSRAHIVLDLKPEGHQFTKLREALLARLSPGVQQHVLTAFWNYLLLMEIVRKVIEDEAKLSYQRPERRTAWEKLAEAYGRNEGTEQGDFSERLLNLVDAIIARSGAMASIATTPEVTQLVYGRDIRRLSDDLSEYMSLSRKEAIWVLIDNLDKSWPVQSARAEDILLIRSLLEASRKLQRQFEGRNVETHTIVFIRNDIYAHLISETSDRGKDTAVLLDWNDPEAFKEVIRRRIIRSTNLDGDFEYLWRLVYSSHVLGEDSFSFVLSRTLMRPREVLRFCRRCLDVAVSRGKDKVSESDFLQAEKLCSEDALVDIRFELKDVAAPFEAVPDAFQGARLPMRRTDVEQRLESLGLNASDSTRAINLLIWFGFLGYWCGPESERFSHHYQHDVRMMKSGLNDETFTVHRSFRSALACVGPD